MKKIQTIIFLAIFVLSTFIRLSLAVVNREANDDHIGEIQIMMNNFHLPLMTECRECFHPKLYYMTAVIILKALMINAPDLQIIFLQLFNVICGVVTLVFVWKVIREYPSANETIQLLVFAIIALNPKLIAINVQVSNDSLVILLSTLALYFAHRFLQKPELMLFGWIVLFCILSVSTKVTAWITVIAIFLSLLVIPWAHKSKKMWLYPSLFFVFVLVVTMLNPLSQFIVNYQTFGTPIVNSKPRLPLPAFFKQTTKYKKYYFRPGIVSIQDGYLTFKLFDLLKYPIINNEQFDYPPARTSFWTLLYADAHSLHFQNWPLSWQTKQSENFNTSRGIFILGLLPVAALLTGFLLDLFSFGKNLLRGNLIPGQLMYLLTFCGYLAFLLLSSLLFRDYGFVKFAYIMPGILAFTFLLLRGAEKLFNNPLMVSLVVLLIVFYVLDSTSMFLQLYKVVTAS